VSDIGPADVSVLKFYLADGREASGSTANQVIRTLSRMLSYSAEMDYRKDLPRFKYRPEKKRTAIIHAGTQETALLEMAPETLRAFLIISMDNGMRCGEVARMKWEHIKWAEGFIHVPVGKSLAATRDVPLTDRMAEALRHRKRGEWVFPTEKQGSKASSTGHVTEASVSQSFRATIAAYNAVREKRNLPPLDEGLCLHSARHSFPGRFLNAGGDMAALKKIMGHSSIAVTDRYIHSVASDAAAIMNRFNAHKVVQMGRRA
jgi:integrase